MKKIITSIAAVLLVASSFAQYHDDKRYDGDKERDVVYNDSRYNKEHRDRRDDRYNYNNRERDMQIAQINREYDREIESVKRRWLMSHSKKEAIICSLNDDRRYEIKKVYQRFNRRKDRFDDHGSGRHW